jgi:DNA helicase-4
MEIMGLILKYFAGEFDCFLRQLSTFLPLYKNGMHCLEVLRSRVARLPCYEQARATRFLDIFERLLQEHERHLEDERLYDFADMINDATDLVKSERDCMLVYRYILLDEVQDLSPNRLRLVREILRKNPQCRLFAVGDDWQSIYRFTGSNLDLIENFSKYFGRHVRRSLIETTHRFGAPTVRLSSAFVQKNPQQARKRVKGLKTQTPIKIILSKPSINNRDSEADGFRRAVADLREIYGAALAKMQLQIISRFNRDISFLSDAPEAIIKDDKVEWDGLAFDFCSIHKSKGITRDIVIVLNMNDSLMGMPAQRENDPLIEMLLSDKEPYRYAEERRLFYVALTRARKATYLVAKEKTPSPFLLELSPELADAHKNRCPRCETGELIRKESKFGAFQYCSNYFYGCNYFKREG